MLNLETKPHRAYSLFTRSYMRLAFVCVLVSVLAAWLSTTGARAQNGALDTTFQNPAIDSGYNSTNVHAIALQPVR